MAHAYFQPGEQRASRVQQLFHRIARRYDLINDIQSLGLHRLWKRRVVDLARPTVGLRALDVCCGTGDLGLALARRGAQVVGLDFTEAMLEVARRRARSLPAGARIEFVRGDAQQLPFADGSFDIVTVGYGLRNLAQWQTGVAEMWRVARPQARLVVLDFGKPANPLWRSIYLGYLRAAVPALGWMFAGDARAYAYILESLQHYPAQRGVAEALRQLGCAEVRTLEPVGGAMGINVAVKP